MGSCFSRANNTKYLLFFLYFKFTRTHNSTIQKIKNSKMQVQNKTQTLSKSYKFLSKACRLRENININNNFFKTLIYLFTKMLKGNIHLTLSIK